MTALLERVLGAPLDRIDGAAKVLGQARYAYEHHPERVAYAYIVQSTIAKGRIKQLDTAVAVALPGVICIVTDSNAPRLTAEADAEVTVLQSLDIAYYGQAIAIVVAESLVVARQAAALVTVDYDEETHDVDFHPGRTDTYTPSSTYEEDPAATHSGDFDGAYSRAEVRIDNTYSTPYEHNSPMEPHATVAEWDARGNLTLYDANQGPHVIRADISTALGIEQERVHVISPHVGGGFGSKLFTHAHVMLAAMAAKIAERPVKLTLTRQQMFQLVGYRTKTIQRLRFGSDARGRLQAIEHGAIEQTSKLEEFAESSAEVTRRMYAAPNRRTSQRLVRLDVPTPTIMRAPGDCPGMYGLEAAMDEMALAAGIDPIEFRIINEPDRDPETHRPFSSRNLLRCLREGAERFGWTPRPTKARLRRDGRWLVGMGVAASTYPTRRRSSNARIRAQHDGNYRVELDAMDIGTGTWTALTQIAADALEAPVERVHLAIGDSALVRAPGAGGSMGLASWGTAIVEAAQQLRARLTGEYGGVVPAEGIEVTVETGRNPNAEHYSMNAFGAQFVEVRIDADTCEIRVPRLLGVFAIGRAVNPKTVRSQLIGGMTMGLSMALFEESVMDLRFGDFANHDFVGYHIATNADIHELDAIWIDEEDYLINPIGAKGVGEIGITGTAAAIASAVFDATGVRVRDLPITLDKLL
jgi:xanthine dehydrogenase YagR molybdenum-binding subunit